MKKIVNQNFWYNLQCMFISKMFVDNTGTVFMLYALLPEGTRGVTDAGFSLYTLDVGGLAAYLCATELVHHVYLISINFTGVS